MQSPTHLRRPVGAAALLLSSLTLWSPRLARGQPQDAALPAQPEREEPTGREPASSGRSPTGGSQATPTVSLAAAIGLRPGTTCLDHDRLVRRVSRWLERDRVDARIAVVVRGGDEPNEVSFRVELRPRSGQGDPLRSERHITDAPSDCDQLHSALALSVALAIDAVLLDGARVELPDDEELIEPDEPAYFRLAASVFANASSGVLTDVSPGLSARIEIGPLRFVDLRLGAFATTVTDQRVRSTPGSFDVRLLAGRVDGCAVVDILSQLRLLGCLGAMVGAFETNGTGFTRDYDEVEVWGAAVTGLEAQLALAGWLAFGVSVDLVLPFGERRVEVEVVGGPPVTRALTSAGVVVGAGPVFRFF